MSHYGPITDSGRDIFLADGIVAERSHETGLDTASLATEARSSRI
jgi:hypothetical protein